MPDGLRGKFPAAAELLESAAEDVLAHFHFPEEHRRRLHSTNPLERLHKEVKRRTTVVGIFPDRASLIRLAGMRLAEKHDEWAVVPEILVLHLCDMLRTGTDGS